MPIRLIAIAATACMVCGCGSQPDQQHAVRHGRFQGIGVYAAGPLWSRMVQANAQAERAAAKLDDDEQVIVVVDSRTGEVRQCGNLSGYCIGMNPWAAAPGQAAPAQLREHAADLERTEASVANEAAPADQNLAEAALNRR